MLTLKQQLLAATIIAGVAAPAQAQFSFPSAELRGVGASTPADINVKVNNCIGVNQQLGSNNGSLSSVTLTDFVPTTPSTSNPDLFCSTGDGLENNIYNGSTTFTGKYVSTGSGFGRQQWRLFTNQFTGSSSSTNPFGTWANVQYALSESPTTFSEYNTDYANNAATVAGAGIQLPLYVVPIAFAYNPQYGSNNGTPLNFRVKSPQSINGAVAGGLKLSKDVYCRIWNGQITNWNHPDLTALNGGQSLRDLNDPQARWDSEGVPIRLVGRADKSGGTDVFSHAMSAQCGTTVANGGTNKFEKAQESLPYDNTSAIDIRPLRSDSNYFPGSAAKNFAGTTQTLSGYVYDRNTEKLCFWNEVSGGACPATPAAINNALLVGKFIVADTSAGIEKALRLNNNNLAIASSVTPGLTLNGKLGYLGADFIVPSAGRTLHGAA
ncbi:MAG TPA: substrate-binding domain-containing protein, partial [Sphingomonas sp.]|nr:substrate-binding domain-containing protein [Sphingomonas sp.]